MGGGWNYKLKIPYTFLCLIQRWKLLFSVLQFLFASYMAADSAADSTADSAADINISIFKPTDYCLSASVSDASVPVSMYLFLTLSEISD